MVKLFPHELKDFEVALVSADSKELLETYQLDGRAQ
jgi:hypothetical protein